MATIKFQTMRGNREQMSDKIYRHVKAGEYHQMVRDHKKNADLVVFELSNRYEQVGPDFARQLKAMEYQKVIACLKIEEVR